MSQSFKSTLLLLSFPSFRKGAARVMDLRGALDCYRTTDDSDYQGLKKDWERVGEDIRHSLYHYGRTRQRREGTK